jgi:hypothetical protein
MTPFEKNIHIRFLPSIEQMEETQKIAKDFALKVLNFK